MPRETISQIEITQQIGFTRVCRWQVAGAASECDGQLTRAEIGGEMRFPCFASVPTQQEQTVQKIGGYHFSPKEVGGVSSQNRGS
jgi:hypothetical protein